MIQPEDSVHSVDQGFGTLPWKWFKWRRRTASNDDGEDTKLAKKLEFLGNI
jgi:hypothetical protein